MTVSTPEVVLAVLIATFRFELSDKPFTWNFARVTYYPAADKDSTKSEMFMKVTLASTSVESPA